MRLVNLPCKLRIIKLQSMMSIVHSFSLLFLTNIKLIWLPLAIQAKTPTFILFDLNLGLKFFLYTSLVLKFFLYTSLVLKFFLYTSLGHIHIFFFVVQGSYSIVASSMNTILSHCYKSHHHFFYTNSLCFSFAQISKIVSSLET